MIKDADVHSNRADCIPAPLATPVVDFCAALPGGVFLCEASV